jgi:hypothetical protein
MSTTTMQLRSGRSLMRRNSRNHEEFQERRRYQREQKQIEENIYDEDENKNSLTKKMKKFNNKLQHLTYVNRYQNQENHSFNEKMQNIIDIYEHVRINMDDLIQYYNNENKHDRRLIEVIFRKGNVLLLEIYHKKRTRQENKNFKKCEELILSVSDLIEYYIL